MINYEERVAKGAALLDAQRPGWEREIDLDVLDISSGQYCVTAQLAGSLSPGSWTHGREDLGLSMDAYIAHGFNVGPGYPADRTEDGVYDELNELWRDLITARIAASEEGST